MDTHEEIFAVAKALPEQDRASYLDEACEDPDERYRVEALLRGAEEAGQFFAEFEKGTVEEVLVEVPGTVIGRYKLLQKIGEGGFGVVFMAEQQEPMVRRVALKVIKAGMDTRQVIARFEAERQALALMDHPNIAKVLDAGATESGRPYFVMELVRGVPITRFCDENHFDTRQRLELFMEICSAVQHAHQKGIIHRDLKPSNILVGLDADRPIAKVIDFGIAKATQQRLTEKTLFTHFEELIGTPTYMSPEQAGFSPIDVDTRTDIYSLGVILYELLAGKPPFDSKSLLSAGFDEMRRIIREEDPPRPSTRVSTLKEEELSVLAQTHRTDPKKLGGIIRGDLDWIAMKALEKDRSRRYETANGLALEIQRFLDDEPVMAAAPSALYQFRKFARRRKGQLAVVSAVAVALVTGAVVSTTQGIRAGHESQRAAETLKKLRAAAPAFLSEAEDLVRKGRFAESIERIDHAILLRPGEPDYRLRRADLLQCQLRLDEAAQGYRDVLALVPDHTRARNNLAVCEELLTLAQDNKDKFSTQALAILHRAMLGERRSTAELQLVARRLKEGSELLLQHWLERLRDLPTGDTTPLEERLRVAKPGRLILDLRGSGITSLAPLEGMPLEHLDLRRCANVVDLAPLRGSPLRSLFLADTSIDNLDPLREVSSLKVLRLQATAIASLEPLAGLSLRELNLNNCRRIDDLGPLHGMPLEVLEIHGTRASSFEPLESLPNLRHLHACGVPATDTEHLTSLPIENLYLVGTQIADLGFVGEMPLERLSLSGCRQARNFAVLSGIETLKILRLPDTPENLPEEELEAISALKHHPGLDQISDGFRKDLSIVTTEPSGEFWPRWDRMRDTLKKRARAMDALAHRDWEGAQEYFARRAWELLEGGAADDDPSYQLLEAAVVLAMAEDRTRYHRLCELALGHYRSAEDRNVLRRTAWIPLLVPSVDQELVARAGKRLAQAKEPDWPWQQMIEAMELYRNHDMVSAKEKLDAIDPGQWHALEVIVIVCKTLALASIDREAAANLLETARVQVRSSMDETFRPGQLPRRGWHDVLTGQLLLLEAENLLSGAGPTRRDPAVNAESHDE